MQRWRLLVLCGFVLIISACGTQSSPGNGNGDDPPPPSDPNRGTISGDLIFPGHIGSPESTAEGFVVSDALLGAGHEVEVVPGELLVRFRDASRSRQLDTLSVEGVRLQVVRSVAGFVLYRTEETSAARTLALAERLSARDDIAAVYPNWVLQLFNAPNDTFYRFQWHYPAMNIPGAWVLETGSSNRVTVAVVDSESINHPDLVFLPGYDFFDGNSDPTDPNGLSGYHRAHVAGTSAPKQTTGLGSPGSTGVSISCRCAR